MTDADTYAVDLVVPEDCDIEEAGETVTIDVPSGEYVLAAARSAGVWLPADCQQGWCTTCAAELLEGEVDQSHAKRYYDVDAPKNDDGNRASGGDPSLVLLCTARPRSDLRLRVCQYETMLDERAAADLPPGRSKR